ncbi:hypothetical protein SCANM63S_04993 [Streptomyces canarius]
MDQVVLVCREARRAVAPGELAAGQLVQRAVDADKQYVLGWQHRQAVE